MPFQRFAIVALVSACCVDLTASQPNIDGGRGDLPGMKQDMFDQVQKNKKNGGQRPSKGPPECPKSDKMSAFASMAFAEGDWFVRINGTEGPCHKLITIGGANFSELQNASLTCGPAGEWKKRIAEEMSMVFFQGGFEWVKGENDTIEVVTTEGTFEVEVNEEKYASLMECWKQSCDCEQAKSPKARIVLITLFIIAFGGLSYDSVKLGLESLGRGKKPSKSATCKKGHKLKEVSSKRPNSLCDICRSRSCIYQCEGGSSCNYDLCASCYEDQKKEARAKYKAWMDKHPEEKEKEREKRKNKKSGDDDEKEDKDDDEKENKKSGDESDSRKNEDSQSEAGDKKDSKKESEAESDAPAGSEDKDETGAEDN